MSRRLSRLEAAVSRSPLFARVGRALHVAQFCNDHQLSAGDGLAHVGEAERRHAAARCTRRECLTTLARTGAAAATAAFSAPHLAVARMPPQPSLDVAIVGAGLAGLTCADALARRGVVPTVYEAAERAGGRCWSLRGVFAGQVAERGGEFIDNLHKTLLGYASAFGLAVEDVNKEPGDVVYYFAGRHIPESAVVDEFRDFVAVMREDLRRLSKEVTAFSHTEFDAALDHTSLAAYLDGDNGAHVAAGPVARAAIEAAYLAEFGLELADQSCLNFLHFIHADRRSKFTPFGVFSDERYHVIDGNDRIVEGLVRSLRRPVQHGMRLCAVRRSSTGAIELTFETVGGSVTRTHDVVVLTLPFSVLRTVALHSNLLLSAEKRDAINLLGYGTNAKMMVGFVDRPWEAAGGNGSSYSDLANHQTTWQTNPARATPARAVLTDYSSGNRGASLDPGAVPAAVDAFLVDLDRVFPGALGAEARRADGSVIAHLEHWPSNPLTRGSYTCYQPGQFTTIAGLEGVPAGNLFFAGEHTNSFYDFQGFMEGAAISGVDAAAAILRAARVSNRAIG
jgi:monoamine oxidase